MSYLNGFVLGSRKIRSKYLGPVGGFLVKLGVKADHLTILGFICAVAATYFLFQNHLYFIALATLNWLFDALDGVVARLRKPTKLGVYFDNIADQAVVVLILIKTYFYFNDYFILIVLGLFVLHNLIFMLDLKGKIVYCRAPLLVLYFFKLYTLGFFAVGILSLYGLALQFNFYLKKRFTT